MVGIVAGSGAIGSVATKVLDRSVTRATANRTEAEETKLDADAAQVIAQTAVSLVAPLQTQVDSLRERVMVLEAENNSTKSRLQVAIDHIYELHAWINTHLPQRRPPQPPQALGI